MEKIYGTTVRHDILIKVGRKRWLLYYGLYEDDGDSYEYRQAFDHKPTLEEIKDTIIAQVDENTDKRILSGCLFQGNQVWLSTENQFNYKAEYDLAVQTNGANLPVTVKLGGADKPVYQTFNTLDEFKTFYTEVLAFIKQCYTDGWKEKDAIDWSKFDCDD